MRNDKGLAISIAEQHRKIPVPLEVTLFAENVEARGRLEAFSSTSLWVRADIDVEDAYSSVAQLDVELRLPSECAMIRLPTLIGSREALDRAVHYRLDYEDAPPGSFQRFASLRLLVNQ